MKEANNSDLLIHEATFSIQDKMLAYEWGHSTAAGVSYLAKQYGIKKLALIHISQRMSEKMDMIINEAKNEFENVIIPEDLDTIEMK